MKDTRKIKLEGKRFGRLIVVEYLFGKSKYKCKCDCGNIKDIWTGDIISGKTKSCGCMSKERELDLVGKKFNRLTVIERCGKTDENRYLFKCICECGNEKIAEGREIKGGKIKSCGCGVIKGVKKANTTHGLTGSRLHNVWSSMKGRCLNENDPSYTRYGGRGIMICDEWLSDFMNFYNWSMENGYSDDLSIDRIDNDGNYEPSNCRWATGVEQQNNRSITLFYEHNNETLPLTEWCERLNLSYYTIHKRISAYGYSFEKAISHKIEKVGVFNGT